jgi:hypothetical protein
MKKLLTLIAAFVLYAGAVYAQTSTCDAGQPLTSFGNNGVLPLSDAATNGNLDMTIDASGNVYIAAVMDDPMTMAEVIKVSAFDNAGAVMSTFGMGGSFVYDMGNTMEYNNVNITNDANGNVYVATSYNEDMTGTPEPTVVAMKFDNTGQLDMNYGSMGVASMPVAANELELNSVIVDENATYMFGDIDNGTNSLIASFDQNGMPSTLGGFINGSRSYNMANTGKETWGNVVYSFNPNGNGSATVLLVNEDTNTSNFDYGINTFTFQPTVFWVGTPVSVNSPIPFTNRVMNGDVILALSGSDYRFAGTDQSGNLIIEGLLGSNRTVDFRFGNAGTVRNPNNISGYDRLVDFETGADGEYYILAEQGGDIVLFALNNDGSYNDEFGFNILSNSAGSANEAGLALAIGTNNELLSAIAYEEMNNTMDNISIDLSSICTDFETVQQEKEEDDDIYNEEELIVSTVPFSTTFDITNTEIPVVKAVGSFLFLSEHGTLYTTGSNSDLVVYNGDGWSDAASGRHGIYGIKDDGTLWSINGASSTQIGSDSDWEQLSVGWDHSLALKEDGTLWAWGVDWRGQMGNGGVASSTPTQIGTDNDWEKIEAGYQVSMGQKTDGKLYGWGSNSYYQLAVQGSPGATTTLYSPTSISFFDNIAVKDFEPGIFASHVIDSSGNFYTWGNNYYGALGNGSAGFSRQYTPVIAGTGWSEIEIGGDNLQQAYGIDNNGRLYTWAGEFNNYSNSPRLISDDNHLNIYAAIEFTSSPIYSGIKEAITYVRNPDELKQASHIAVRANGFENMVITFAPGNGNGRLVVLTPEGSTTYIPTEEEKDNIEASGSTIITIDANAISGSSPAIPMGDSYILYKGNENTISINGLEAGTNYTIQVFEYYPLGDLNTETAMGNPRTIRTKQQLDVEIILSDLKISGNSIFADWTIFGQNPDMYMYETQITDNAFISSQEFDIIDLGNMSEFEFGNLIGLNKYIHVRAIDMDGVESEWQTFGPYQLLNPEPGYIMSMDVNERTETSMTVEWNSEPGSNNAYLVFAYDEIPGKERFMEDGYWNDNMILPTYNSSIIDYSSITSLYSFIDARIVYYGNGNEVTLTNMRENTPYYLVVVPLDGLGDRVNYGSPRVFTHTTIEADAPLTAPSNITIVQNGTDYEVNWDSGSDKTVLIATTTGIMLESMENGMAYSAGDMIGEHHMVVGTRMAGDGSPITLEATLGNTYTLQVFGYTGDTYELATGLAGTEGSQHYTEDYATYSFTATGVEPSAVDITVTGRMPSTVDLDWADGVAAATVGADNYLVIAKEDAGSMPTGPSDSQEYLNGNTLGSAIDFGDYTDATLGDYSVVYNGSGTNTTVTGLDANTTYNFYIFPYSGGNVPNDQNYASIGRMVGTTTFAAKPMAASGFEVEARNQNTIVLGWDNESAKTVLVYKSDMEIECTPMMGDVIDMNSPMSGCTAELIYMGTGDTYSDTGLMMNTEYHYAIYARAGEQMEMINTFNYSDASMMEASTKSATVITEVKIDAIPETVTSGESFNTTISLLDQYGDKVGATSTTTVGLNFDGSSVGSATIATGDTSATFSATITTSLIGSDKEVIAVSNGITSDTTTVDIMAGEPSRVEDLSPVANRRDITVTWDIPSDADGVVVYIRKRSATNQADPTDGSAVTVTTFDDTSTDSQAIYVGGDESLSLTNLSFFTRYYFAVYTYTGSGSAINYNPAEVTNSAQTRFKEGNIIPDADYIGETFNITDPTPNPVSENITFELQNEDSQSAFEISLIDVAGAEVAVYARGRSYSVAATSMNLPVPSQLANGIYYLHVTNGEHTMTKVIRLDR